MKIQEFINKAEEMNCLADCMKIREVFDAIVDLSNGPIEEWSSLWHRQAIQDAKRRLDEAGISYPEC